MSILFNQTRAAAQMPRVLDAISSRLQGPGGYYNLGNILGLAVALGLQLSAAGNGLGDGVWTTLRGFFAGSPASVSLTACTLVFLVSGEVYRAAWVNGSPPDQRLNRIADLVSAIGAVLLGLSLLLMGQTMLALVSVVLTAGGKLGSAITGDDPRKIPFWPLIWPDPMRAAVLIGRAPGLAAPLMNMISQLSQQGVTGELIQPATLFVCYLLWIKADWMLLDASRRPAPQPA